MKMAAEWVTKQQVIDLLHYNSDEFCSAVIEDVENLYAIDVVPRGAYCQASWERDLAIEQLRSYGVGLGEEADVQSVVRCKDCRYSIPEDITMDFFDTYECRFWESEKYPVVQEDDFCSYGVRRRDEVLR